MTNYQTVTSLTNMAADQYITPANVDQLLDRGQIEVRMKSERWWAIRRNGRTQKWKTRPNDFRIPIKFGFKGTSALTHHDFVTINGVLQIDPTYYRRKAP